MASFTPHYRRSIQPLWHLAKGQSLPTLVLRVKWGRLSPTNCPISGFMLRRQNHQATTYTTSLNGMVCPRQLEPFLNLFNSDKLNQRHFAPPNMVWLDVGGVCRWVKLSRSHTIIY